MDEKKVEAYWQDFLETGRNREIYGDRVHPAWYFCNNEEDADSLLQLVLAGTKRGTASLVEAYDREGETLPVAGDLSIITNWSGDPHCIIETLSVTRCNFSEVTDEMAAIEGEGDGSLAYWRRGHERFFGEELRSWGKAFSEDVEILFEEFRVIYRD